MHKRWFVSTFSMLLAIVGLGMGLRLLAWHWHEFYPLGGDEREYLDQALRLLRDHQYIELRLMRPPLYPITLASWIYLVDSLVQNLRLVQACISSATIPFVYLLSREVALQVGQTSRRPALLAALLCALSYTLAVNATELLTEALFLFGLTIALWLIVRTARTGTIATAGLAGLIIGALCLVRSVALPLIPLAVVWLAIRAAYRIPPRRWILAVSALLLAACLIIIPWSARNYVTYGGLILIDTTGAENLWLDNDPAGREAVKSQLYAMGEDRLARQQVATRQGIAAITGNPGGFATKAWGELKKFFALEFSDDLLARPAIWVPPAEVWMRLVLGDGIWLLILLAGGLGLGSNLGNPHQATTFIARITSLFSSTAWLLLPWALYVSLTTLIFHVELRYRLPLYPALLPFAGLALTQKQRPNLIGGLAVGVALTFTLLHTNYPALTWQLGWKHFHLAQAEAALDRGNLEAAQAAAQAALQHDSDSSLAQIVLARAQLGAHDQEAALHHLNAAIATLPAHPYAHLLRGDLYRHQGHLDAARTDLAYETSSLEDLQGWMWDRTISTPPSQLDLGRGLDLGFIQGFHSVAAHETGFRWSNEEATLRLLARNGTTNLVLWASSGRPDNSSSELHVSINGQRIGTLQISAEAHRYTLALPTSITHDQIIVVRLENPTFSPRNYDQSSPDGRRLGVKLTEVTTE